MLLNLWRALFKLFFGLTAGGVLVLAALYWCQRWLEFDLREKALEFGARRSASSHTANAAAAAAAAAASQQKNKAE